MTTVRLEQVRDMAAGLHMGQKYGAEEYIVHLEEVADLIRETDGTHDEIIAAYLHDSMEDTTMTAERLQELFGATVRQAVEYLTDMPGATRAEKKAKTYARFAALDPHKDEAARIAWRVKIADRLCNIRTSARNKNQRMLTMYRMEHPIFQRAYASIYGPWHRREEWMWIEMELLLHPDYVNR